SHGHPTVSDEVRQDIATDLELLRSLESETHDHPKLFRSYLHQASTDFEITSYCRLQPISATPFSSHRRSCPHATTPSPPRRQSFPALPPPVAPRPTRITTSCPESTPVKPTR